MHLYYNVTIYIIFIQKHLEEIRCEPQGSKTRFDQTVGPGTGFVSGPSSLKVALHGNQLKTH
jgi:hypothetical protein